MWRKIPKEDEPEYLKRAIEFTGNWQLYGAAMKKVSIAWPNTMINSLTNPSINQRAFIGHCACQFEIKCPEYIVRMAWKELTNRQRFDADNIAQKVIDQWKLNYRNDLKNKAVHSNVGNPLLF